MKCCARMLACIHSLRQIFYLYLYIYQLYEGRNVGELFYFTSTWQFIHYVMLVIFVLKVVYGLRV